MAFTIDIKGRIPSKKNSKDIIKRGKRKFIVPSKKHQEWHDDAMWQVKAQKPKYGINRCSINLLFRMPDNRRADLSNKEESIMDLLVDAGVITDDSWQVVRPKNSDCIGIDKKNPGVLVTITEL